jgi:hypothetical protein
MEGLYSDEEDDVVRQHQEQGEPDLQSPSSAAQASTALSPQAAFAVLPLRVQGLDAKTWTIADVAPLSDTPQACPSKLHTTLMQWARACGHEGPADNILVADLVPHLDKLISSLLGQRIQGITQPGSVTTPCKARAPSRPGQIWAQLASFLALYGQRLGVKDSTLAEFAQLGRMGDAATGSSRSWRLAAGLQQKGTGASHRNSGTNDASLAGVDQRAETPQAQSLSLMQHPQQAQLQAMLLQRWLFEQAQPQQAVWVLPPQQHQAPKPPEDTSLAALLLQCPVATSPVLSGSSSDDDAYNMHLLQLQGYATSHFGGLSMQSIPAALVVMNHMWSVQERANACLAAAAGGGAGDGAAQQAAVAACMAARQEVQALLRLAAQPVMVWLAEEWGWQHELGLLKTAVDLLESFCHSLARARAATPGPDPCVQCCWQLELEAVSLCDLLGSLKTTVLHAVLVCPVPVPVSAIVLCTVTLEVERCKMRTGKCC